MATERTVERWVKAGVVQIVYVDNEPYFGISHATPQS